MGNRAYYTVSACFKGAYGQIVVGLAVGCGFLSTLHGINIPGSSLQRRISVLKLDAEG